MTARANGFRVAGISRRRSSGMVGDAGRRRDFATSDKVLALAEVKNDGTYPHKEIGEVLVHKGDIGCVFEGWCFLGQIYYTVEFVERAVVVIMRGRELAKADAPIAV